jgi:hypothetical protein
LGLTKAVVWRDQAQIELPTENILLAQPVFVYYEKIPVEYRLALMDQPLFIKNKDLYVLKEEDGFFFMIKVSPNGEWKVAAVDFSNLSAWEDKRQNISCPADQSLQSVFGVSHCKTVWDLDLKKTVVVKMHQGCFI